MTFLGNCLMDLGVALSKFSVKLDNLGFRIKAKGLGIRLRRLYAVREAMGR